MVESLLLELEPELVKNRPAPQRRSHGLFFNRQLCHVLLLFRQLCPQLVHLTLQYNNSYVQPDDRKRGDLAVFPSHQTAAIFSIEFTLGQKKTKNTRW